MSAAAPRTRYDVGVDYSDAAIVRAPFRVRTELRHAPSWGQAHGALVVCTSDNVDLDGVGPSYPVVQPLGRAHTGVVK